MDDQFDFERLEVYRLGQELSREVAAILRELPRGAGESADNLRRATKSITRNIGEGCGKWHPADKIFYFQIARGSANECGASLNELVEFGYVAAERIQKARGLALRIVASLVGLIRFFEKRQMAPSQPR